MPSKYDQLIPTSLAEEFCYLRGLQKQALLQPHSLESDVLYRLVAREMAQIYPPLIISYVEMTISTQCTLKCAHCANLMPLYTQPPAMDLEGCLKTVQTFCSAVDHILMFRLMGGEPLMQKQLGALVEAMLPASMIQHIQIVTNGTLLVPQELVKTLQNPKCSLFVSNYGPISKKRQALLKQCQTHGILVQAEETLSQWCDMGDLQYRNIPQQLLLQVYAGCNMECRHLWNGELHVCPRSAHGTALGAIPRRKGDYVPLLTNTDAENREQIRKLYDVTHVTACAYCNSPLNRPQVPCGT